MSPRARIARSALILGLALWLPLAAAPAGAEGREFNGVVVWAGERGLLVENRMGDERRFRRSKESRVKGKPGWEALAPGDRVIVEYVRDEEKRNRVIRVIVLGSRG